MNSSPFFPLTALSNPALRASSTPQAVKPELVLHPTPVASGQGEEVTYDFALDPA